MIKRAFSVQQKWTRRFFLKSSVSATLAIAGAPIIIPRIGKSIYSRKWKVYVIQSVHAMLGWARSYDQAQVYFDQEIRGNLDLMDQTDDRREEEQHHFLADCSWIVTQYLRRNPGDIERVLRRMREGRLEMSAYEASVTDLCFSGEELIRCLDGAAKLERIGGGSRAIIACTDIHSFSFGLPSLASGSGIRYLMVGANDEGNAGFKRYPSLQVKPRGRALYWWEGIDGQRILCFNYGTYSEAGHWRGKDFTPSLVEPYLKRFESMGESYPYDSVVMFGTGGDGIEKGGFHHSILGTDNIRDWNREHDSYNPDNLDAPLLINGHLQGFFESMEASYGSRIPSFRGGWGGGEQFWDNQPQLFAKTGLQGHRSSARIRTAEMIATATSDLLNSPYPRDSIGQVFQYRIWYDEHDANGAVGMVSQKVSEEWRAIQRDWGENKMERPSVEALMLSLGELARGLAGKDKEESDRKEQRLLVFNPLSRQRTDVVRWPCNDPGKGRTWKVVDIKTNREVRSQVLQRESGTVLIFIASDMPSLGYRVYNVKNTSSILWKEVQNPLPGVIENEFYRVEANDRASIRSIWDKKANRELVAPDGHINVYSNFESMATSGEAFVESLGPVGSCLSLKATGLPNNTQSLKSSVWLYPGIDRIDFINTFSVEEKRQDVFFEFSFNLPGQPRFTLEGPSASILTVGEDEFDEAKLTSWNTFSFIDVSVPSAGVTFFSPDARQIFPGGTRQESKMPLCDLSKPSILVRVMGGLNGGDLDNPFEYRFALTTHSEALDIGCAVDSGWAMNMPLVVCAIPGPARGARLPNEAALWRVPAPLVVSAFKLAEDAKGGGNCILRLWNPTSQSVNQAVISSDLFIIESIRRNDHMERDRGPALPVSTDGSFVIDVGANELVTVRLFLTSRRASG